MGALVTVSDRGQVTIPAYLRNETNILAGKKLFIYKTEDNSGLLLQPVDEDDVMDLYASVDPNGESTDPQIAIDKAKVLKAKTALI